MNSSDPSPPVPVAIIGMGCMFPQAEDLARYWANILQKTDSITEVPESHWSVADYYHQDPKAPDRTYAHRGGFLTPVEFPLLDFGIAPHSIEATDTTQLLGLLVARAALADAGYLDSPALDRDRVSVILGVTGTLELVIPLGARLGHPIWRRALQAAGVDERTTDQVVERIASSYVGWQEGSFPGLLGNVAAGRIANRLDLHGTNCVVDSACASSLAAVNLAMLELGAGRCDLAVTGGLDTFNDIFMYMCFSKTPALSPTGDARPFDSDADGTILGEGLGVLVLKRLADARRDGDRIYAVIRAMGTSSDGMGQAVYAPSPAGQVKALKRAYELAGIAPGTVELVEAHGTGTKVGDAAELEALETVYQAGRTGATWCALGSVKSQVGHTKAAAGAAGLIKTALALYHQVLPPTAKVRRPIEQLASGGSPFYLNLEPQPWLSSPGHPRRAAVSAFGFGGSNFHCVLEEAAPAPGRALWDGDVQILAYSAGDPSEIRRALDALERPGAGFDLRAEAANSRARFRSEDRYRVLLVVERGKDQLGTICAQARARLEAVASGRELPENSRYAPVASGRVFVGTGAAPGLLAMLFPGQGSQYPGMLRGLACQFTQLRSALSLLNEVAASRGVDRPLSDWIYPRTCFDDDGRRAAELALRDTRLAQPAIGGVSLGLWRVLDDFGVRPDMTSGHSFGELSALCAAGRIDDRSLLELALARGEIMAGCALAAGPGAMLAVFAPAEDVAAMVRQWALDVVLANHNAPSQCVLSGPAGAIERCKQILSERKIACHVVPVSAAFHSALVADAEWPLRDALATIAFARATIPVFANTTAAPYPDEPDPARALLAGQLARPVQFVAQVEAMYGVGARTFVEVGPDSRLTGLVRAILGGRSHAAIAVDASRDSSANQSDLACLLATLAALGYAIRLDRWDDGFAPPPRVAEQKRGFTVKIGGANARPKLPAATDPHTQTAAGDRSAGGTRPVVAAAPGRLVRNPAESPAESVYSRLRDRAEIDRTMNPNHGLDSHSHRANGQGAPEQGVRREHVDKHPGATTASPAGSTAARDVLAQALEHAQENLVALQRLAEQTALLHRQFLEGQQKTQETFLRLLEHQERLSLAAIEPASGSAAAHRPASPPVEHDGSAPSSAISRVREAWGELETHERNGHEEPPRALGISAGSAASSRLFTVAPVAPAFEAASSILVEVVADKTGYPAEVIGLDMQLDADLGIDSIKRVEILSAWQEKVPELPPIKPEQLGTFRTLRALIEFAIEAEEAAPRASTRRHEGNGKSDLGLAGGSHEQLLANGDARAGHASNGVAAALADAVAKVLVEAVADKTGYPAEMLELDMRLDADLGIDSIKRVEILSAVQERLPDAPAIGPEQLGTFSTLRQIVQALQASAQPAPKRPISLPAPAPEAMPARPSVSHKNGVAGRAHKPLSRTALRARPLAAPDDRPENSLSAGATVWVLADGSQLAAAVERELTGRGYRACVLQPGEIPAESAGEPASGLIVIAPRDGCGDAFVADAFRLIRAAGPLLAVAGLTGAAGLLTVSRLDGTFGVHGLPDRVDPAQGALAGMAKTAGHEWPQVSCKAVDLDPDFAREDEAARLIVNELLKRGPAEVGLSARGHMSLHLETDDRGRDRAGHHRPIRLDRSDLVVVAGGARGITAEVALALARAFQPTLLLLGRTPAPGDEPAWRAGIEEDAELKRAILARSDCSLGPRELADLVGRVRVEREVRRNLARITAAGSTVFYRSVDVRDRKTVQTALAEISRRHGPVRGLIHGAGTLADRKLVDQTDEQFGQVYDTKVKGLRHCFDALDPAELSFLILFSSSTARFGRSGQVAYAAANEALNKWAQQQSARLEHCRVISYNWGPWAGGMVTDGLKALFEKEGLALISPEAGADLVVTDLRAGGGGAVEMVVLAERGHPGPGPESASAQARAEPGSSPAVDPGLEVVFERIVDLAALPVLAAHVIDTHAVLPLALVMEWLAEAAAHRNPGMAVRGVDNLRLFKGVVLADRPSLSIEICAGRPVRSGAELAIPVELRGTLAGGREVTHARAVVVLADDYASGERALLDRELAPYPATRDEIYETILFHGSELQGIEQVEGSREGTIAGWVATAPPPEEWIDRPLRATWLTEPLAVDSAFQLVVLWCRDRLGANSLPTAVGRYRQFRRVFPPEGVRVVAEVRSASDARAVADIEFLDVRGGLVARLESYECVVNTSLNQAFRRNQLAPLVSVLPS